MRKRKKRQGDRVRERMRFGFWGEIKKKDGKRKGDKEVKKSIQREICRQGSREKRRAIKERERKKK